MLIKILVALSGIGVVDQMFSEVEVKRYPSIVIPQLQYHHSTIGAVRVDISVENAVWIDTCMAHISVERLSMK